MFNDIKSILSGRERSAAYRLLIMMFIGMILEMLGVGLIVPLITLLTQNNLSGAASPLTLLGGELSFDETRLAIYVMLTIVIVYFTKNIFLAFLLHRQTKFAYSVQANLSLRLFASYIHKPYPYHLQQNSAELIRNATTETNYFASHALIPAMQCMAEILVVLGLSGLLFFIEPMSTLIVTIALTILAVFFFSITRAKVERWSIQRQKHEGIRLQLLQQGLSGIKDIILSGRQQVFLDDYSVHNRKISEAGMHQEFLKQVPRLSLEFIAVFGLTILVTVMVSQGRGLLEIAPVVGAFAAAGFRLMPSVNRIVGSAHTLRYMRPVVSTLVTQLNPVRQQVKAISRPVTLKNDIRIQEVTFSYVEIGPPILKGANIVIKKGQCVGIVGVSGAGKSTLLDLFLGLIQPRSGLVLVDGVDIQTNLRGWHKLIGYVPQFIYLSDDSLKKNIAYGIPDDEVDETALYESLKAAQLEEFVKNHPFGVDMLVGERGVKLSGGQRQRIGIARALYHNPSVIILDEATSSLDRKTEDDFMASIDSLRGERTILIVAHDLTTVRNCDVLYRVADGSVVLEEPSYHTGPK